MGIKLWVELWSPQFNCRLDVWRAAWLGPGSSAGWPAACLVGCLAGRLTGWPAGSCRLVPMAGAGWCRWLVPAGADSGLSRDEADTAPTREMSMGADESPSSRGANLRAGTDKENGGGKVGARTVGKGGGGRCESVDARIIAPPGDEVGPGARENFFSVVPTRRHPGPPISTL